MKLLPIALGGFAGLVVGYFAGAYVACTWFYPTSNLCGIVGVFYTGPAGLVIGAIAGWWFTRSRKL